jgi:hypothetical protein
MERQFCKCGAEMMIKGESSSQFIFICPLCSSVKFSEIERCCDKEENQEITIALNWPEMHIFEQKCIKCGEITIVKQRKGELICV